ncbi:hypothetical protein GCM10010420_43070 [Streptomyces glaucosporus]|uniref:Lipoprotein n=1 Tax=Streptomyces glaucosporus TaxID=284044 RepID=A0ABN3IQS2_9ACTN
MRIRATVAAVTGALALSALSVPAAQAGDSDRPERADVAEIAQAARDAQQTGSPETTGKSRVASAEDDVPYAIDVTFSKVKVNNGKPIVAGTKNQVTVPLSFTLTHGADVDIHAEDFFADVAIYRGASYAEAENVLEGDYWPTCTSVSDTVANCKGTIDVYPYEQLFNEDAATWKAVGYAIDFNGQNPEEPLDLSRVGYTDQDSGLATTKLQRYSKLTVNASPEPVAKGKTITITGKLTRANWDTSTYKGYTKQPVKLQFRKKGTDTYTTLKTVYTDSTGSLKTTRTASVDGYWRWNFAGTSTTPAVKATGDYVDVK